MRATVAILGGTSVLIAGFYSLSEAAQQSKDAAVTNGSSASGSAWNTTTGLVDGLGQAAGPGIVYAGIGAIILIALGLLVAAGNSGR